MSGKTSSQATVEVAGRNTVATEHKEVPPSIFIPTLYFAEGLPYTIVKNVSNAFFKNMGASNDFITLTTNLLSLPWSLKFIWAPLVDLYATKRKWILVSQAVLTLLFSCLALTALTAQSMIIASSVAVMALIALASATHDIAIDGYYMDVLPQDQQAFFVGVRNAAYKVSWLVGSGGLMFLAGKVGELLGGGPEAIAAGWYISFLDCAVMFGVLLAVHYVILPHRAQLVDSAPVSVDPEDSHPLVRQDARATRRGLKAFMDVARTFFKQDRIVATCTYILIFRLGDALMLSVAMLFLLDPPEKGGLGISTATVGIIYGTVGMIFLLIGGILGGWLVSKFGLRKTLMPTALIMNFAILLYWALAAFKPDVMWVAIANSIEQFAYGLGTAAYTVFLLSVVKPEYKASHYAIATAMMAAGLLIPGAISGKLTLALGYQNFFLLSFLVSIPGIITIPFLPLKEEHGQPSA